MALLTSRMVKDRARKIGFDLVGVVSLEGLRKLPVGDVEGVKTLIRAEEELHSVRSCVVLGYHIWDPIFNVHTIDPS